MERLEYFCQTMLYGRLVMTHPNKKAGHEKAVKIKRKLLFSLTVAARLVSGYQKAGDRKQRIDNPIRQPVDASQ
jgi:hypothetical protein